MASCSTCAHLGLYGVCRLSGGDTLGGSGCFRYVRKRYIINKYNLI